MNIKRAIKFLKSRSLTEDVVFLYFQDGSLTDKEADLLLADHRRKEKPEMVMYTRKGR